MSEAPTTATDDGLRHELPAEGVLVLTIDRPEHNNAWNPALEGAYLRALDRAAADDSVRVVVLTGAGRMFCPGMDSSRLEAASSGRSQPYLAGRRRPQTTPLRFPKPLIAAVNGACAGTGFVQAVMCDLRFTCPEAKWSASFARVGLVAEDALAWRLQRLIGAGRTADVLLSSRVLRGSDAESIGLANACWERGELLARTIEYASDLAQNCSPLSLTLMKRQLLFDAESNLEEARLRSVAWLELARTFPDFAEGVTALRSKRPANFPSLPSELEALVAGPSH